MAANVQGLAMWRYSVLRKPGLLLSKDNKAEDIFYSWALLVSWICRWVALYRSEFIRKAAIPPNPLLAALILRHRSYCSWV